MGRPVNRDDEVSGCPVRPFASVASAVSQRVVSPYQHPINETIMKLHRFLASVLVLILPHAQPRDSVGCCRC